MMDEDMKNMDSDEISLYFNMIENESSHKIEYLLEKLEASDNDYDQLVPKLKRLRVFLDEPPPQVFCFGLHLRPAAYEVENAISDVLNPCVLKDLSSKFQEGYIFMMDSLAKLVFRDLKSLSPSSSQGKCFPRTDQRGFIKYLVGHLEDVLQRKADSIRPLKLDVQELQEKFKYVLYCLMEIPKSIWEEFNVDDLLTDITNLAYETEFLVDGILVRNRPLWFSMYRLIEIDDQLDHHLGLMKSKNWLKNLVNSHGGPNYVQVVSYLMSDPTFLVFCVDLLYTAGFGDSSGKRFDSLLLCYIGEIYEKNVHIDFQIVDGEIKDVSKSYISIDEYRSLVAEILPGRRYLVVVAIVDEDQALVDMLSCLPENDNGSRVVVATSSQEMRLWIQGCPCMQTLLVGRSSSATPMLESAASDGDRFRVETEGNGVVGFKDEFERMMNWLLGGKRRPLEIASIFGMAGQGKTTLANKLFKMASGANYFHVCAWCCVSQVYKLRQLVLDLLSQIVDHHHDYSFLEKEGDYDLMEMLHKNLLGRTFFIVMDDIWDLRAWDELRRCFPNQNNGSCILFTTRIQDLALKARPGSIIQQPLNPLSDDESWELFKIQLYLKKGSCFTDELQPTAKEIVGNCKGLPLAIVLSAGLISKMDGFDDIVAWGKIAKALRREILEDSEAHCQGTLELSYRHLPDNLKACFLYLGSLPENEVILVTKITRLWIAEGFIHSARLDRLVKSFDQQKFSYLDSQTEITNELEAACEELSATMQQTSFEEDDSGEPEFSSEEIMDRIKDVEEETAEGYLMELVQRSLVQVASQKSKGGVKACQVHDLLRSFCSMKAKEDHFLLHQVINNGHDEPQFPSAGSHFHRLAIAVEGSEDIVMSKPSEPNVRSLLLSAATIDLYCREDLVHFICGNFKFLKILSLEGIDVGESFWEITNLVHLRYLAVKCSNEDCIPHSITNLCNLETLIVFREGYATPISVPDSIWDISELKHVDIFNCRFQLNPLRLENASSLLENLHSLSNASLSYGVDMEKFLKKLPNIQKLNCKWDDTVSCNQFLRLECLDHLEALKVSYTGGGNYSIVNFPSSLIKLALSHFRMPWRNISQLTKLSNLRVLKLKREAFEGEAWEMQEEEVFPNLRFLKLDSLDLVTWIAFETNFPCLEHLVLHRCKHLQEIPAGIGDIPTLQRIEVMWCNSSTLISAREIQREQLEYGNECLKIHVHPREFYV